MKNSAQLAGLNIIRRFGNPMLRRDQIWTLISLRRESLSVRGSNQGKEILGRVLKVRWAECAAPPVPMPGVMASKET